MAAALCAVAGVAVLVGVVRPPAAPTRPVVVAARAVPAGSLIAPSDVRVVRLSESVPLVGALARPDAVVGRQVAGRLEVGEVMTPSRLVPRTVADGLPRGTVAAHVTVADPGVLDLVSAGRRITLFADTGGPALAQDVLVLAVDTPERATFTGSLPGGETLARGLVVALNQAEAERIFAGQRPEGGPPTVLAVVTR
ncbi:Flp pilus assembly protein CpaB [Knoellia subterranea KCTC 19937]|uniref:Flp pilus assembly protein CpaB n=2 Tax=Knoellia TaxID=136099 RepID=A0A0A0JGL5_9MICO|nr:Flp pilus assembly protein CpaB [Knoellia subterranea KCTC 19937]